MSFHETGKEITLMKMDIDGPDSAAMRGAEKLFEQKLVKCVHFVSIDHYPINKSMEGNLLML